MPKQMTLKYMGKSNRNIGGEGVTVSNVSTGQEVMLPEQVAKELLAMNGPEMERRGEVAEMWVDITPKAPSAKKSPSKKSSPSEEK